MTISPRSTASFTNRRGWPSSPRSRRATKADFVFLLNIIGLTKATSRVTLAKLEQAGLVEIEKRFEGKQTVASAMLSGAGREALKEYWKRFDQIRKGARAQAAEGDVASQDDHAVLRHQAIAHEPDGGVDPLVGLLEAPAAEHEEEDALILRGERGVGRMRPAEGRPSQPGRLRRQRMGLEQADLLVNPVLQDGEVFLS